ncbi:MAG: hypothetical protein GX259_10060 [Bacteroidales bacterium]|nr:hypothetical protein [Bacteroidales bacterium]
MKKKYLLFTLLFFTNFIFFAQESVSKKFDFDYKIYTSSLFGLVTGDNPYLGLRENPDEVDSCFNFMVETRASIISIKNMTFSWSFGMGSYVENNKNHDNNLLALELSLGTGIYFHLFNGPTFPLNGLSVYLYPLYQIPIYTENYKPYLNWKSAIDVGYNLTVLNCITVYPFVRNIIGWNSKDIRYGLDCGLAIGLYFHDNTHIK